MLFFQLMSRRCERAATVLTSNEGFESGARSLGMPSWPGRRSIASSTTANIRGNSHRMRQHADLQHLLQPHDPPTPRPRSSPSAAEPATFSAAVDQHEQRHARTRVECDRARISCRAR